MKNIIATVSVTCPQCGLAASFGVEVSASPSRAVRRLPCDFLRAEELASGDCQCTDRDEQEIEHLIAEAKHTYLKGVTHADHH